MLWEHSVALAKARVLATKMITPGLRRWATIFLLAVGFMLLLNQLSFKFGSTSGKQALKAPAYTAPARVNDGRFNWADVPARYPPSTLQPLPTGNPKRLPKVQHAFKEESVFVANERRQRRQAVKEVFVRCWRSYKRRAWMKDELSPISGGSRNAFGGWAATLVDALDTLYIMDMKDDFNVAADAVKDIDFSTSTESELNVFETTIRYLGGLLAAYDLSADTSLLDKAVEVGEMLYVALDTPNHMPVTRWDWQAAASGASQVAPSWMLVSEIGSLSLEFTRLSQLTENPKWFDAIQRISDVFVAQQNLTKLPGMWPIVVNPQLQDFTGDTGFTLGGMSDSLYEYFPKEYALLGGLSEMYRDLYDGSMNTAIKHAFFRPMVPDDVDILISGDVHADSPDQVTLEPKGQHLGCFTGGMLGLGGRLFNNPEHVSLGRKLVDGCIWAYNALPFGMMPETFHMVPCPLDGPCSWEEGKWHYGVMSMMSGEDSRSATEVIADRRLPPGFTDIGDTRYILRPEAIESVFILYRITGDRKLQDAAWKMFLNIYKYTKTEFGNAALDDVTITEGEPPKSDRMESFWMAETLKYFYLIFSEPDLISLDEYVL